MANEDTVFREVDQELAEERQWRLFRTYGPAAIGAGLALVVAVGAYQLYRGGETRAAQRDAVAFADAEALIEEAPAEARAAFAEIAEGDEGGYGALARFRRASLFAAEGERDAAIAGYREIYQSGGAPRPLRALARLRAAYLALDEGRDAALSHIGDIADEDGPFRAHAEEVVALAALGADDFGTALSLFRKLSLDFDAPASLRARADGFAALAAAGQSGVSLSGGISLDDLGGALAPADLNDAARDPTADLEALFEAAGVADDQGADEAGQAEESVEANEAVEADEGADASDANADGAEAGDDLLGEQPQRNEP